MKHLSCQYRVYISLLISLNVVHPYVAKLYVMYSEQDKTRLEMYSVCLPQVVPYVPRVRLSVMKLCMYAWIDGWMCEYSMYVCPTVNF